MFAVSKWVFALWLTFCLPKVFASADRVELYQARLPDKLWSALVEQNSTGSQYLRPGGGGTFSWRNGYITAVEYKAGSGGCMIYVFDGEVGWSLFAHEACAFRGQPKLEYGRSPGMPDILYDVSMFSPLHGVVIDLQVAFFL